MYSAALLRIFSSVPLAMFALPLCVILGAENGLCKYALKDCRQRPVDKSPVNHKRVLAIWKFAKKRIPLLSTYTSR